MENFFYQNKLIGIRMRGFKRGIQSITGEREPLQALAIRQQAGTVVKPHLHRPTKRITTTLQECLIVVRGKIRIDLFGKEKKVIKRVTLGAGDLFITVSGAHSVTFLTDAEVYEIKNGPYMNDREDIKLL